MANFWQWCSLPEPSVMTSSRNPAQFSRVRDLARGGKALDPGHRTAARQILRPPRAQDDARRESDRANCITTQFLENLSYGSLSTAQSSLPALVTVMCEKRRWTAWPGEVSMRATGKL
jgi:hypothetical protein